MAAPGASSEAPQRDASAVDDELDALTLAVRASAFHADDALVARIEAAIGVATTSSELGRLLVVKMLAVQGQGDPARSAELGRQALPHLLAAGLTAHAAFAATTTAVFLDAAGEPAAAIDQAVDALVMLDEADLDEIDTVRASLALAGFYMRRCAFDLAIDLGRRTFEAARRIDGLPIDAVAYSVGYISAEGGHVAADDDERDRRLGLARETAQWLREHGKDAVSTVLLGPGLDAEADLALGIHPDHTALERGALHYDDSIADFVAWHRLVRGIALARREAWAEAISLIDAAEPGLRASSDDHCLVRALRTRADARAAMGDFEGAYAEARGLAELTRRWQIRQVGDLADQVARRADLERSSSLLRTTAQRLAADIDRDSLTGVRSRHWLERELDAMARDGGPASAVMLDIDHFKTVNDTHGHHVGDRVLARVGELLLGCASERCEVARFGGEEFAVIFHTVAPSVAVAYAEQVRLAIEAYDWTEIGADIALTISAGVASGDLSAIRPIVVAADAALLDAKRAGRNRVMLAA